MIFSNVQCNGNVFFSFKQIKLSFLMVGNMHEEDIDGMFGCFSKKLKRQNATTMDELKDGLSASETDRNPVSRHIINDELTMSSPCLNST